MILSGKPVAQAMELRSRVEKLGMTPTLCLVRLGENPSDLSYERGILRRGEEAGVEVRTCVLPETASAEEVIEKIKELNLDETVHGVLLFRPLPAHLKPYRQEIYNALDPQKDVDGMTDASAAGLYLNRPGTFPPCTPCACMEVLHYYGIPVEGKRVAVVGRSAVVGLPLSMLLLSENATVTVCHSRTKDLPSVTREAEILISAVGKAGLIDSRHIAPGAVVLDVGVNWSEEDGRFVGDVADPAEASAYTPVPGGIGAVTNTILMSHVIQAAERLSENGSR